MANFPSINPAHSVIEIPVFDTLIIGYGNKTEQRLKRNSTVQKTFRLTWRSLNNTDKASIYDFYVARGGAFESFSWTNPVDNVAYTVRFKQDTFNMEYFSYQLWNLGEVEFVEVTA
jgi:phage-related protein